MRAVLLIALVACATSTPQHRAADNKDDDWSVGPSGVEYTNQMIPADLIWTGRELMFASERSLLHPTGHGPMMIMLRSYTLGGELIRERPVIEGMRPRLAFSGTGFGMTYTTPDAATAGIRVNFARLDRNGAVIEDFELGDGWDARIAWNATRREYAVMWAHGDRAGTNSAIEITRFSEGGDRLGQATIVTAEVGGVFSYGQISGLAAVGDHYEAVVQTPLTRITTDGRRLLHERVISDGRDTVASLLADRDGAVVAHRAAFALRVERLTAAGVTGSEPLHTALVQVGDPIVTGSVAAPWLLYNTKSRERWAHLGVMLQPLTATMDLADGIGIPVVDPAIVDWVAVATVVPGGIAVGYQVGGFQQEQDVRIKIFATTSIAR